MNHNEKIIVVHDNGHVEIGTYNRPVANITPRITLDDRRAIQVNLCNPFPLTSKGIQSAFELALELKLQEAQDNIHDGHEAAVNQAFVDACKAVQQ